MYLYNHERAFVLFNEPQALFTPRENADISMRFGLIYTKLLSQKTIISKHSGQSGEFGKLWFGGCV